MVNARWVKLTECYEAYVDVGRVPYQKEQDFGKIPVRRPD